MDPLSFLSTIFKVAPEIAKVARTARRNRRRCLELAERAGNVGDLLRDSKVANDTATRTRVLGRLSEALGDALKLVESCRRGGFLSRHLAAGRDAGRFDDVEKRINNCILDLGIANDARVERRVNQLAAHCYHPGINAKAGSVSGKGGKQMKEKAAAALPAPRTGATAMDWPPPQHHLNDTGVPYYHAVYVEDGGPFPAP